MSIDVSRIEKVEVAVSMQVVNGRVQGNQLDATLREVDARDLMHEIAMALGYDAVKRA